MLQIYDFDILLPITKQGMESPTVPTDAGIECINRKKSLQVLSTLLNYLYETI